MAKYNREFLVPYLENICALHIIEKKLQEQCDNLRGNVSSHMNASSNIHAPSRPYPLPILTVGRVISFAIGCILIYWAWIYPIIHHIKMEPFSAFVACNLLAAAIIIPLIVIPIKRMYDTKRENEEAQRSYSEELYEYELARNYAKKRYNQGLELNKTLHRYMQESNKVSDVLQKMYNANIIPLHYRDLYASVYLYDFFRTSHSDDLDMALSLYVLEQIKSKLDIVIQNQSEMILNQCIMMANQQKTFQQQQAYHDRMMDKLNLIQVQGEERNQYLQMIESNTAASAYFAAAEYIRSI